MSDSGEISAEAGESWGMDIGTELPRAIADGRFKPGDRIGAERELASRHGVSRWVVRKALEPLEEAGLIYRTHGRSGGVFVAHKKVVRDLNGLVGLPEYLKSQGIESGTTVVETKAISAGEALSKALEISPDDWVFRIMRVRFSAGFPLSVEWCHFPAEMFPGLLDESLVGSIYELLDSRYGLIRGDAVETIEADSADKPRADLLQIAVGSPLLAVRRTARDMDGKVFEYSRELYRAERATITVHTSGQASAGNSSITRRVE